MINNFIYIFILLFLSSSNIMASALDECVNFSIKVDRQNYHRGENLYLKLDVNIDEGFHIYSTHPDKSLSPSYIEFTDSSFFSQIGILHEPKTVKYFDKNFNQNIHYHKNSITLIQDLKISESAPIGEHTISATFIYLACDPTKCIPKFDDFSFVINIKEGSPRSEYSKQIDLEYSNLDSEDVSSNLNDIINEGFISFLLFSFGMGFLSLLTPCVFPMIPITVSYFTKEGEKENNNPVTNACIYAFGIIIIFTCLGLLLSFTIGASGAGDLAANPWVNLFIGGLFIYLAFSLFGYYEIQIPSSIRQFSLSRESKGGKLGILFMSLTFTLTSFTCTVAFVGALLAAASRGAYFWPIVGMLSFSTAFAFPFFFLALFPQYLSKLPKSGGWLNSIKVVMGFLELAAAFKFISNSDLVWDWGIFTRDSVLAIWALIFILTGLYLLGKIKMPFDSKINKIGIKRIMFSTIFFCFGFYLSTGLVGNKIHGLIESYLPPKIIVDDWVESLDEGFFLSSESNKPIFIDFTGYTCTNCRWMEINVFELPEVKKLFEDFVLVKLYTDGKEEIHLKNRKLEIERFGTAALPYYVVLTPSDKVISTFPGMDPNPDNFIKFLTETRNKFYEK